MRVPSPLVHNGSTTNSTSPSFYKLARVDLGPRRETICTPTATSLVRLEPTWHRNTSLTFCTSMSTISSSLLRMAPSCSSTLPCRTSIRSLTSTLPVATVPLGSSIILCETSARSSHSVFGPLRIPRMLSATQLYRCTCRYFLL